MSPTKKNAVPPSAEAAARRRALLAGALLGWALAYLAGALLSGELQAVQKLFLPLSALAGGVAGLGAWVHLAGLTDERLRSRRLRQGLTVLAASLVLLTVLYPAFVVRIPYEERTGSIAFLKGWSRSGLCESCSADDALCMQEMGLDPSLFGPCWNGRSAVQSALMLCYLMALGGFGGLGGVLAGRRPLRGPAAPPGYLDFDVWIDRQDGGYRAKAWSGGAGFEATRNFTLSPALEQAGPCSFANGDPSRGGGADAEADGPGPEEIGGALFDAIFQGELLKAFQGCLAKSEGGLGLRLRLRLNDVPHLSQLPWEYLYQEGGRGFLALSPRTPVVRYMELSQGLDELRVAPPLRVLAVISTPGEYRELDEADVEWERLQGALTPLLAAGLLEVERLEPPTRAALAARLQTGAPVHVLHFVGHGGYSELRGEGVLVFEGEEGDGVPVGAQSLAYLAQDHPSLRLAVLNSCNGARGAEDDAFAGTAQALVRHGVPAVIAMQAEVTDSTACLFAERFYRGLAGGLPVDACMGEVRRALAADGNPEWGTPVLYLRATDGRLFEVAEAAGAQSH